MVTLIALFIAGVCLLDAHNQREKLTVAKRRIRQLLADQPERRRGRQPGEPINLRYASDRAFKKLIRDIEALEPLRLVDSEGGDAA